ncbi:MAG TPA: N-acetyltransferase [Fusobacteriaceae bacterium]|nr:N-acetyltransferase [Fusobacteriaceae bacterium]
MYEGKLVRLREYRKGDIERAKEFLNDFEVRKNLQPTIPYPFTLEDEEKWYSGISAIKDTYTFALETLEDRYIGGCGINSIDWKNSKVVIGIFIGDKEYWSKGYGSDAINILVKFIFDEMNINKIALNVYSFNERAIKCYEKCGFKREGVLREELFRQGRYHDEILMSILKSEVK